MDAAWRRRRRAAVAAASREPRLGRSQGRAVEVSRTAQPGQHPARLAVEGGPVQDQSLRGPRARHRAAPGGLIAGLRRPSLAPCCGLAAEDRTVKEGRPRRRPHRARDGSRSRGPRSRAACRGTHRQGALAGDESRRGHQRRISIWVQTLTRSTQVTRVWGILVFRRCLGQIINRQSK